MYIFMYLFNDRNPFWRFFEPVLFGLMTFYVLYCIYLTTKSIVAGGVDIGVLIVLFIILIVFLLSLISVWIMLYKWRRRD